MMEDQSDSHTISDHNLLYGVMALRAGLITPDQLIAAIHSWVDSKSRSITGILIDCGYMTVGQRTLLDSLVRAFIAKHNHNIGQCLESLTSLDLPREDLAKIPDSDVERSLLQLGDINTNSTSSTTDWAPDADAPKCRFQVQRSHAQGGLGRVSVALDLELHREVAFKEILDEFADDPSSRDRFRVEAEITGRLEHPGIVPVYGLGQLPNGRPFYAMQFIQGPTLKAAIVEFHRDATADISRQRSALRRLVERFLDVCDVVSYAHSRGVLHRDLKPANVMLGRYGETLVVDWGLAKATGEQLVEDSGREGLLRPNSGSSVSPTRLGRAVGSPPYMSPEQAAGNTDEIGPRSDVYGLGAMLYHILSGKTPVEGSGEADIISKVIAGQIDFQIEEFQTAPMPLADICRKAMASRPDERYPSVLELRDSIQQWLDDEPISLLCAAVSYIESLCSEHPDRPEYQERLGKELASLSKALQSLGRFDEAILSARRAVDLLSGLCQRNKTNLHLFQELFYARSQLSLVLQSSGRGNEADDVERTNRQEFENLVRDAPRTTKTRDELFSLTLHQGYSLEEAERLLEAYESQASDSDEIEATWAYEPEPTDHFYTKHIGAEALAKSRLLEPGNRYTVLQVIGKGALGTVYRVRDNVLPRNVALKALDRADKRAAGHLIREAAILSTLNHPGITPVYDLGFDKTYSLPYFTMKLVEGQNWNDIFAGEDMPDPIRFSLLQTHLPEFVRLCEAIHHAHSFGVLHLDPKPRNIVADGESRAWLIDWGICRVFDIQRFLRADSSESLKRVVLPFVEGEVIGTPAFMSPEQVAGVRPNQQTDIYLLGSTLFFMLTGSPPHKLAPDTKDVGSIFRQIAEDEHRRPRDVNHKAPRSLDRICSTAMARNPDGRYLSARELGEAVKHWIG